MLETATDVGFLDVDTTRGVVLFEGGVERWAVRGDDIVSCQWERLETGHIVHYYISLDVRNAAVGRKTRYFATRRGGKASLGRFGRKWADAAVASIDRLRARRP